MWIKLYLVSLVLCTSLAVLENNNNEKHSFAIDYDNNQFLLDGKPFQYISGSFHYFRAPHQHWRDILRKMRAAGLNAVSTYVEWSMHEPEPNKWVWEGDANLIEFIKIAQEENLLVILRPGPYICAEREFGGFPYWLLTLVPQIKLRTRDENYLFYVEKYLNQVLTKVKPYLRGNGGPIIMVQVENEYGSFYACDEVYKKKLYEIFNNHIEKKAVLFTTDGPTTKMLKCGSFPNVYATVDFGSSASVKMSFVTMRLHNKQGPLVNSEYYPGWLSHWDEPFQRVETKAVVKTLHEMLVLNASINFYMFYGGTNFGFTSGANINKFYTPQLTSYDYDAPLNEAGDPTQKYFEIREAISKYFPLPNIPTPVESEKGDYGTVLMQTVFRLFDLHVRQLHGTVKGNWTKPPTFETLNVSNWLVLYETNLPLAESSKNNSVLRAIAKDRALVYLDGRLSGVFSRMQNLTSLLLGKKATGAKKLQLLVENQGRVNFGNVDVEDFKGIFNVTLNNVEILSWNATSFQFNKSLESTFEVTKSQVSETGTLYTSPQILIGYFNVTGEPLDTYLNTAGWGKGIAFVNGYNLGRYWPLVGPQITLYVPAPYLKTGQNTLVLVELEYVPDNCTMKFQTFSILDYPNK